MSDARDVLMRTKRLLTSGTWTQHTMRRFNDHREPVAFCLVGGLRETTGYYEREHINASCRPTLAYMLSCEALAETIAEKELRHSPISSMENIVIGFNDARNRTVSEVAALIDRAVEKVTT